MLKKMTWGERLSVLYAIFMMGIACLLIMNGEKPFKITVAILSIPTAFVPLLVQKMWKKKFDSTLLIWYIIFLFGSQFLGTVMRFYKLVYWDMLMHALAGVLLGFVGIELLKRITTPDLLSQLSSAHVFWFVKGVGVFGGAMWEVYEFTTDQLLGTTMQGKGNPDTMTDLIFDLLGSYLVARWYAKKHEKQKSELALSYN
ncbi:MAG: hypothetical protein ACI35O_00490 [Bacillaceae bacterium]